MIKKFPSYNPESFESKWQTAWEEAGLHQASKGEKKPRFYCLDYFPYPSGEGLHVGHCRNYVPTDVISRFKRMQGYNVLHPMGWDSFGEPAEQNAIQHGVTPRVTTDRNTANYKRQMKMIGTSYDWSREIDSSDPSYYRWTQWMFLKMFQQGLVYRDTNWQWYCPTCATTLSSHEIEGDRCWRGHPGVTKVEIPAWFFKITAYADELITALEGLDWPDPIKRIQRNWIGRSEGIEVDWQVAGETDHKITTFTTRPDTLFGVTFLAVAPEHPLLGLIAEPRRKAEIEAYVQRAIGISEIERTSATGTNTGVFTGRTAIHPLTGDLIPIFAADYVLPTYGGGAVMGVPGHDNRDFNFAQRHGLAVCQVVIPPDNGAVGAGLERLDRAYTEPGILINSDQFNGCQSQDGSERISDVLEDAGKGRRTVQYRMRDWLISRQRYWGTPIPIIHCDTCGQVPIAERHLPVLLPEMKDFEPDGSGLSPLARVPKFVQTDCPECGRKASRETDTLGGFACSSWYFLRFPSHEAQDRPFRAEDIQRWLPVDLYVGGPEHAVLHLLYARFWTKFLADNGLLPFREPFTRLVNQGQLHGPDGARMSKSRGNVIVPDEMVAQYGADALRIHGLFMAPFSQNVNWSADGIKGARRFLNKVWNLYQGHWDVLKNFDGVMEVDVELAVSLNQTIQAVSERIDGLRFNTMISVLMVFVNELHERIRSNKWRTETFKECLETLIILLAPTAPHVSEELWEQTGHSFSVHQQMWPNWDENLVDVDRVEIAVQVDGRVRGKLMLDASVCETEALEAAHEIPGVLTYLNNKKITRVIYVPGKILNVVTKN